MSNNYFQFKQFIVQQDQCAMKICTDACLFGAIVASKIRHQTPGFQNILDIGTGTGLLSLMLAQQVDAGIDAVEIDEPAYLQAKNNFEGSPWKERLSAIHADILQFPPGKKYDHIISNPPFFEDDLRSPRENKNKAMHDTALTLQQLVRAAGKYLEEDGCLFVLLPFHRSIYFEEEAVKQNLYLSEKISIRQTPQHDFFRCILSFSKKEKQLIITELAIKDGHGKYSGDFINFLKEYYLYL